MRSFEWIGFCGSEFKRLRKFDDAEKRESVFAFIEGEMRLEDVGRSEHDVRARRDEFAPEFAAWIFDGDGHQAESPAQRIGADEEGVSALRVRPRMMVD